MPKRRTDIPLALDYIARVVRKRATVFLISDFIEGNHELTKPLSLLSKRHDVIAVPVRDRVEIAMPSVGLMEIQDAETGEILLVDTSSRRFRSQYGTASSQRFDSLTGVLRSINVDFIPVTTDRPYINDVIQFFHMRHRRQ
jgi:hypothetical protein